MKKRLCIAVILLSAAGLQAADTGSGVKNIAQKFGGGAAKPQTDSMIEPEALIPLTRQEVLALKGYLRTPRHVGFMLAHNGQFAQPDMKGEADRFGQKLTTLLTQKVTKYLLDQESLREDFSKDFSALLQQFATGMFEINRQHENRDNTFAYDGQERRSIYAKLALLRAQLEQGLYDDVESCYKTDCALASASNLLNPGRKFPRKVHPSGPVYANSVISRIAGERREAKAQAELAAASTAATAQAVPVTKLEAAAATETK